MEIVPDLFQPGPTTCIFLGWETHEFDRGRVGWFCQWSMGRDQSLLWAHLFLSWVCSWKMQASAYSYLTEPTGHAVKGKEGHYLNWILGGEPLRSKQSVYHHLFTLCTTELVYYLHSGSSVRSQKLKPTSWLQSMIQTLYVSLRKTLDHHFLFCKNRNNNKSIS